MGGSLGLALKRRGWTGGIAGWARKPGVRAAALEAGAVDRVEDTAAAAARGADLVVLCVPILAMPGLARDAAPGLKDGAVVTDVGSTKTWLEREIPAALTGTGASFVGSHPIAGSEQSGFDAARADLYEGSVTVVTASVGRAAPAAAFVREVWRFVGSAVIDLNPAEHDRIVARTSHLPHLAATLVAIAAGRDGASPAVRALCGPGFRDTTRVAAGSPAVWRDILESNSGAILDELQALRGGLESMIRVIEEGRFDEAQQKLEQGRQARLSLWKKNTGEESP
jgi:prephenate dehydrogenase